MNYIGEECFGCGKKFEADDDVVVCPDCGTPYHRICYKEAGECVNHQLHESGESWHKHTVSDAGTADVFENQNEKTEAGVICPRCGCFNQPNARCCLKCGMPLDESQKAPEAESMNGGAFFGGASLNNGAIGFNPDEEIAAGVTLKEATQFVDANPLYYIPLFKRMKDFGTKISLNFVCLFFPSLYFANRKMWIPAVLIGILSAILSIPELLYIIGSQSDMLPLMNNISDFIYNNEKLITNLSDICSVVDWLLKLLCCLFANWIYFRHTIKKITKTKAYYGGTVSPGKLKSIGSVKPINILFMALILMGISLAVEFIVMIILTATQL